MYLPDFADKFAAIIVISSHELFKDNSLMDVAERAAIFKKFIPVLFDCVAPPTSWFSMYSNIDLNRTGGSRDREFERLVVSLMNKVL